MGRLKDRESKFPPEFGKRLESKKKKRFKKGTHEYEGNEKLRGSGNIRRALEKKKGRDFRLR